MWNRRLTLVLTALGVGVGLLGGAFLLSLPYLVDLPRAQALLRSEASRLLDRPVRFERVSIALWPLPAVRVRGLTVANGAGFGPEPVLTVEDARVRVRMLPLLRGRLQFGEVRLIRPRVVLEQRRDGAWNLPVPGRARPSPAAPFVLVSRVRLEDGRVEVRLSDPAGGETAAHLVDRIDVTLEELGWANPMRINVAARLPGGGLTVTLEGELGPLAAAKADLASLPARFVARLAAQESQPGSDGTLALSGQGQGELRAEGRLGDLAGSGHVAFARLTVAHTPAACPRPQQRRRLVLESVELPLRAAGPTMTIEPFTLRVAGGTVQGGALLTWRAGVPSVRLADLRVRDVATETLLVDFLCQPYALAGRLDGAGELGFSGTGPELLRSARGTWRAELGPGRVVGPAALTLLSGLLQVGSALASAVTLDLSSSLFGSPLEFRSMTAAGTLGGGQLRVREMMLQGRLARVTGAGSYGLLDTRLDFDLEVRTGRSAFGVKVGGTAREPRYRAGAPGLSRGFGDPLGAILSTARPAPGPAPRPGPPSAEGR